MIKIIHVITSLTRGGAESMLCRLIHALPKDKGYEHVVVCLTGVSDFPDLRVPIHFISMHRGIPSIQSLIKLRRVFVQEKPDIVQGWMYHGNIAASILGKLGVPVVWGVHHSLHDFSHEKFLTRILIKLGKFIAMSGRVSRIIYCSVSSARQHELMGYPARKSLCIPNGFDCEYFSFRPNARKDFLLRYGIQPNAKIVGIAARFHPIKNHPSLLKAFVLVLQKIQGVKLLLSGFGVGPENKELIKLIDEYKLSDSVYMLGQQDDMPTFYSTLDIHVLCSRSEGFPNVLGEAMASGIQCISTNVGDAALIIGGTGFIVPVDDHCELADAIVSALMQPKDILTAKRAKARVHIENNFSLPVIASKYAEVYYEMLN